MNPKKDSEEFRDFIYSNIKPKKNINGNRKTTYNPNNELSEKNLENMKNSIFFHNLINPTPQTSISIANTFIEKNQENLNEIQTLINNLLGSISNNFNKITKSENVLNQATIDISTEIKKIKNEILNTNTEISNFRKQKQEFLKHEEQLKKQQETEIMQLKDKLDILKFKSKKEERELFILQNQHKEILEKIFQKNEELSNIKNKNSLYISHTNYYNEATKTLNKIHSDIQPYKNQMNNEYQEAKGNMRVFCRVRPLLQRENLKKQIDIEYNGETSIIIKGEKKISNVGREGVQRDFDQFQFNRIFKQNSSQEEVFEEISPLIQSSLNGFNINIFAYGQTGSGKTFTMEGDMNCQEKYGIIPRSVDRIFKYFEQELKNIGWSLKLFVSVCEIYNKKTRDLIGEKNVDKTDDLKDIQIFNIEDWKNNFAQITLRRKVAETKMNMESSRSHLIFKIKILLRNNITSEEKFGSLNLIDLAGSERVDKSTVTEERFKESIEINSSLTHLKSVFAAMKSKHDKFIPFHNTPLTDVLKDCLSGENSKTLMFVNISPLLDSFKESTCSLRFATDVNKCYVTGNGDDSDVEDDKEKNAEIKELTNEE